MKKIFLLTLIFLLALFLRLWQLGQIPSGFHNDEVDVGYVGKFIFLNGRDPAGNFWPLAFNKFGDFRPTGLFYLAGFLELFLGSSEFVVRLAPAFSGALTVLPLFFLAERLFKAQAPAILSGFLLAILPWHIVLSRAGHEAIVGYFFIICGLWFLIDYQDNKKQKLLIVACLFLVLSYLFYHGTRLVVPLILLMAAIVWRKKVFVKLTVVMAILTLLIVAMPAGRGRLAQVVFYQEPGLARRLTELSYADLGNLWATKIFHNKAVVFGREILRGWMSYFSADFLFWEGGYPARYRIPEVGLLYVWMIVSLVVGFVTLVGKRNFLSLGWLLIAPLPAILTYDDVPSITRSSFAILPLVLISGYGLWKMVVLARSIKWLLIVFVVVATVAEMAFFGHQYFVHQRLNEGFLRDEGTRELVQFIDSQKNNFDLVVVPFGVNLPFYYFFYNNIFDRQIKLDISDKAANFAYGNVFFVRDSCPAEREENYGKQKVLYINEMRTSCVEKPFNRQVAKIGAAGQAPAFEAFARGGR